MEIVKRVDSTLLLKGCNRYQGCISFVCERNVYFYVVIFFKINVVFFSAGDIMQKYFHVRSNLRLTHFHYFLERTAHVEGIKIPKPGFKCTCRLTRLLNLDTACIKSRNNIDGATPFPCKQNNVLFYLW